MRAGRSGFTLIELLVVISIIVILASIGAAVYLETFRIAGQAKCANNMRQVGLALLVKASGTKGYPPRGDTTGGNNSTPGRWDTTEVIRALGGGPNPAVLQCASSAPGSVTWPGKWSTCSYTYLAKLSPTYKCVCPTCGGKKEIWKLYWSGVDYRGGHIDGARSTDKNTFSTANGFLLASNLIFNPASVDSGEATVPTIPEHQDTDIFTTSDRPKYRTERALRAVPDTAEDQGGEMPLLADIVVFKALPTAPGTTWKNAHTNISETDRKNRIMYANHCSTSATGKKDWGINVFYTNGSVRWKRWDELRFQVMAPLVTFLDGGTPVTEDHYYFY